MTLEQEAILRIVGAMTIQDERFNKAKKYNDQPDPYDKSYILQIV